MAVQVITAAELAAEFEVTPREIRKFLRSVTDREAQPGKGSRWSIEKRRVASLRKQFAAWDEARKAAAEATDEEVTETE